MQKEAKLDQILVRELIKMGHNFPFKTVSGKTVCTNDFYEGQARLDGAFCSYTKEDKLEYLRFLKENGVSNIEMESTCFAALTHQAGIRSAVVCVALLDRLNEDQVNHFFVISIKRKLEQARVSPKGPPAQRAPHHSGRFWQKLATPCFSPKNIYSNLLSLESQVF